MTGFQYEALFFFRAYVTRLTYRCFLHGARPTAQTTVAAVHRACLPLADYNTTTLPPSSTLRVWLIVLWLVALSEMTAIDHVTTPPPHHHLSPGCLFCVSLCVIQHCHCSSCSQHSAPTTAADSVLHACGRSVLYSRWLVIVVGIFFFFNHHFHFQLNLLVPGRRFTLSGLFLNKPWSQVSSLLPPGTCLLLLSLMGFSISTARRFSSNVANSRFRAFRCSFFCK